MIGPHKERVTYDFSPRLKERLERAAEDQEVSMSHFVRDALKRRLDDVEPQAAAG